ncbi:MAG: ABC transporter ATP-binding protein [Candidatus Tectomicrobia bacterium]|uniref:ABC transporter ATP-binding protein n=1 Tax=Tectimicrobiota bacterium TaxID=2528274 RepID=A0A933GKT2_UNCTE|nr:ABC transporter ATP-binding protein [Candidatus Tectomicrobia bacterium]
MLKIENLVTKYGNITAVKGISLEVNQGEIVSIIGSNGAGKSTTLKTISGLLTPAEGCIKFQGKDITAWTPDRILRLGIAQVPEGNLILGELTVRENLLMGAYIRKDKDAIIKDMEGILNSFPPIANRINQRGNTLSGGERQMLAIGRALMSRPSLLLMDEPSLGLAPLIVEEIFHIIRDLSQKGVNILLVEQNARQVLELSDRGYVMEVGSVILCDSGRNLLHNDTVIKAYLGVKRKDNSPNSTRPH